VMAHRGDDALNVGVDTTMRGKLEAIYCVLVVTAAVLVAAIKCTACGSSKTP